MARYSAEFKRDTVRLFRLVGITKTCKQMHVTRATVYRWARQIGVDHEPGIRNPEASEKQPKEAKLSQPPLA